MVDAKSGKKGPEAGTPVARNGQPVVVYEVTPSHRLTPFHASQACALFSSHYGFWAASHNRVRMGPRTLKGKILPHPVDPSCSSICVRALINNKERLIGHVFASQWKISCGEGEWVHVVWITQLVVSQSYRRLGIATTLIQHVQDTFRDWRYAGVLSAHPAAIQAVGRVFGTGAGGVGLVELEDTRRFAKEVMESAAVDYVRKAELRGRLFGEQVAEEVEGMGMASHGGCVAWANTGFYIDHAEVREVLRRLEAEGKKWRLGDLPVGCEFVLVVERK